jgi:hypothetical protein
MLTIFTQDGILEESNSRDRRALGKPVWDFQHP